MSQPTPYTPTTDFSQQESNNAAGRSTVNTAALDAEFANIENTLDATVNNLALIQRDDGKLSDELVEVQCLSRDVLNLIGGFVNRGDWVTATAYSVNDIVAQSGYLYWCSTAHTSSASFATDSAKWKKFGFTPADGLAAAAAQASIDAHITDTSAAHLSTAIQHGATTVSAAISALESSKANLASPSFSGSPTAPTVSSGDTSLKLANTSFVANAISSIQSGIPSQTGNANKVLTTDGTNAAWGNATGTAAQSMVRVNTANGYGSTNTKIRRFSNVVTNQGSDITYADSASLGASFTINTSGVYAISYSDAYSSGADSGISLNTTVPTTSIAGIPQSEVIAVATTAGSSYAVNVSASVYLASGSVIRPHNTGAAASGPTSAFAITRVS